MKRLIGILFLLLLTSLACSFTPNAAQTDFPTAPATSTATALPPTWTPLPAFTATNQPPSATPLPEVTSTQAPPDLPTLSVEQLRNATLTITGSDQLIRTLSFKDGKFQQGADAAEPGFVSVNMGEKIGFGDLNGDGLQDAAITIHESFGGTGVFALVVAVLNDNGQPNAVASVVVDDRPIINDLQISSGQIMLNATVHGPGDPGCCAAQPSTRKYQLIENNLVLTRLVTKTPNGMDRTIQIDSPANGSMISGAFVIKGSVTISPFENNLVYSVFLPDSNEPIEQAGFIISADGMGGPGTFELTLDFNQKGIKGPLRIEISDTSPADGSTLALASLFVLAR